MSKKRVAGADFSQLKALADRFEKEARMGNANFSQSRMNKHKLIRIGGNVLMDGLIRTTPIATKRTNPKGSNWYRYTYNPTQYGIGYAFPRGIRFGDTHYKGTLATGWVVGPTELIDRPPHRKPTLKEGRDKVKNTEVMCIGSNTYVMQFVNAAPFSMAVEIGHVNKVPRVMGGDGTDYFKPTVGRYYTDKTVKDYGVPIKLAIQKEYMKMVKNVIRGGYK